MYIEESSVGKSKYRAQHYAKTGVKEATTTEQIRCCPLEDQWRTCTSKNCKVRESHHSLSIHYYCRSFSYALRWFNQHHEKVWTDSTSTIFHFFYSIALVVSFCFFRPMHAFAMFFNRQKQHPRTSHEEHHSSQSYCYISKYKEKIKRITFGNPLK